MSLVLPFHIAAGIVALLAGYLGLVVTKGAPLHRRAGMVFVYAMVTMSLSGALMEALTTSLTSVSVVAGLLTFYFVVTALRTVRPKRQMPSSIDTAGVALAVVVSMLALVAGVEMAERGRPEAAPSVIFGMVGLLGAAGDMRMIRAGGIQGSLRLRRHLWRMCFAMWVAAASFFWGPPNRVPEMIRIPLLQAVAVLIPIGAMVYWRWRLRGKNRVRGVVTAALVETT